MSGQGQQKGGYQQQYGNPYPGNPGYMDQNSLYNPRPGAYGQSGYGGPMDYGGGYFSMGNSGRAPFGQMQGMGDNPGNPAPKPFVRPVNPFQGASGGGAFQMPGSLAGGSVNPFQGATGGGAFTAPGAPATANPFQRSDFGPPPPPSYTPTAPGNVDPNSPEYAAYYYGLAPSTRAFLAAPGSAQAQYLYNRANSAAADPNAAQFHP